MWNRYSRKSRRFRCFLPISGWYPRCQLAFFCEYVADTYLYDGSHGCINTPYDATEKIFNVMEIGYPVVVKFLPITHIFQILQSI